MPEDDQLLQASQISSTKGSARGGGGGGGDGATLISEQKLLAASGASRATASAFGGDSAAGSTIGRGTEGRRMSVDGRQSLGARVAGGPVDRVERRHGHVRMRASQAPFVDQVSKVQRLQRSRLGRFNRESRVQRRWEELKGLALTMQQQEVIAQRAARSRVGAWRRRSLAVFGVLTVGRRPVGVAPRCRPVSRRPSDLGRCLLPRA